MNCPYCASTATRQLSGKTSLGYLTFRCSDCSRRFNERTATPYNHLQYPTDIVLLVVMWRLRYKLSLRDLAEMFLVRGFEFTHETVRDWEARFAPLISEQLRARRRGKAGHSWHLDETYVKVNGKWCYLYRAIDRDGNLVDSMLSEHRDMDSARPGTRIRILGWLAKRFGPQLVLPTVIGMEQVDSRRYDDQTDARRRSPLCWLHPSSGEP